MTCPHLHRTTAVVISLLLCSGLSALCPAQAQDAGASPPPGGTVAILFLPLQLPLLLLAELPPAPAEVAAGTETFELLHDRAEAEGLYAHLKVPENVFLEGDKERSERIAKDALPKKEDPSRLQSILLPLAAVALEAMDARY